MQKQIASWLPQHTGDLLRAAASAAREALGDDLLAVLLVGSAMHPERAQRARRPEALLVVQELPVTSMARLAKALRPSVHEGLRPRVVTPSELERGADVFALELAEWKARHWLIEGADPFATIEVQPKDLRHMIEFNLRRLRQRLRNRVLVGMATSAGSQHALTAVLDALDSLSIVGYHTLGWLEGEAPPLDDDVFRRLGSVLGIDVAPIVGLLGQVRRSPLVKEPSSAVSVVLELAEQLTNAVDGLDATKQEQP